MAHKAGFVNIIGAPNAGKSTLMNLLMGQELAIVTPKAQTTRHRIRGIINGEDHQIVLSDTPGIMEPAYKLHEKMLDSVNQVFADSDIILLVTEISKRKIMDDVAKKLKAAEIPVFVLVNKIDISNQNDLEAEVEYWNKKLQPTEVIPISALENFNIDTVVKKIISHLPESPAYFDKETLTDRNVRFFIAEIIREQIFLNYDKEIPYNSEVSIDRFKEEEKITKIGAYIFVERDSQKGIILGHQGKAIKRTGTNARIKMEEFLGKKVFLELHVKVRGDWRNSEDQLKRFGYGQ
ncbi:MAG: GTPase Era [Bacteroidia bacterium]|nr:GTPase Era [Bacteroidia bacterium]